MLHGTGISAALSYLRVLPSPDHNVLSLSFCLSLHPYPAAESGNAASDRAVESVMMRRILEMSHTPGCPKVRRGSLVLIALPGALPMGQSNVLRHILLVQNYRQAELAAWYANICISGWYRGGVDRSEYDKQSCGLVSLSKSIARGICGADAFEFGNIFFLLSISNT